MLGLRDRRLLAGLRGRARRLVELRAERLNLGREFLATNLDFLGRLLRGLLAALCLTQLLAAQTESFEGRYGSRDCLQRLERFSRLRHGDGWVSGETGEFLSQSLQVR